MPYRKPAEDQIDFMVRLPADLHERAMTKAKATRPPSSLRWIIIQLLERYAPAPEPPKRVSKPKREPKERHGKIPIPKTIPAVPSGSHVTPDLGDSF